MNAVLQRALTLQRWDIIHRFCAEDPGVIGDLAEAQRVLATHAGHGSGCRQFLAALHRTKPLGA